jgi:DNA-binding NtrC family response regulator
MVKILVIDDDNQMRNLIRKLLIRDGHEVFTAQDGIEGVQSFHQLKPDLIITDIVMPNKNGIELIADIIISNPSQAIIAMPGGRRTFNANSHVSNELCGVKGLLHKPFAYQQLQDAVNIALN